MNRSNIDQSLECFIKFKFLISQWKISKCLTCVMFICIFVSFICLIFKLKNHVYSWFSAQFLIVRSPVQLLTNLSERYFKISFCLYANLLPDICLFFKEKLFIDSDNSFCKVIVVKKIMILDLFFNSFHL